MPNRKRKKPKVSQVILEKGKFYNVHDRSKTGHPGRIEKADFKNDTYISITTRSLTKEEFESGAYKKQYIELNVPTSDDVYVSVIHKKPFIGSRLDYGNKEFTNLRIDKTDEITVKSIVNKRPRFGYWFKKRKKAF